MTPSLPTIEASDHAWMNLGDWNDRDTLAGNHAAFEALRNAIDKLLSETSEKVYIQSEEIQIACLQLQSEQPKILPTSFITKVAGFGVTILLGLVFFLGIASLLGLVAALFS
ncbi:hypothetical protein OKA05_18510 [Luteolibacter arcticus]|uniref:Uncharacterized protein n=1 Tax=Luteolibacter arcticus TaxID=1581411 RepID=A0ABT3GM28_9BACT|nr:hypothetical protein [Luteolibacter arcticus]MCW1924565.1 hypothetical protein [Luteolibacter arcticus]